MHERSTPDDARADSANRASYEHEVARIEQFWDEIAPIRATDERRLNALSLLARYAKAEATAQRQKTEADIRQRYGFGTEAYYQAYGKAEDAYLEAVQPAQEAWKVLEDLRLEAYSHAVAPIAARYLERYGVDVLNEPTYPQPTSQDSDQQ